ncbi:hypothetical protein KIPB_005913 [Kipferlia bialata]|uniref:Uncharacterized protein n=1 Tax=Kipferlia bialata TaxID=797122 RepID=A0A9K3CY31_9EUKA|nr:hypothetical protein KIPB_005913 [Kipferlia bialata]|eukprot:g5913.t1
MGAVEKILLGVQKGIMNIRARESRGQEMQGSRGMGNSAQMSPGQFSQDVYEEEPQYPTEPEVQETPSELASLNQELREANEILDLKVQKLQQLVRLKDSRIQALTAKLQQAGLL